MKIYAFIKKQKEKKLNLNSVFFKKLDNQKKAKRVTGLEPVLLDWKSRYLPLMYTRLFINLKNYYNIYLFILLIPLKQTNNNFIKQIKLKKPSLNRIKP